MGLSASFNLCRGFGVVRLPWKKSLAAAADKAGAWTRVGAVSTRSGDEAGTGWAAVAADGKKEKDIFWRMPVRASK